MKASKILILLLTIVLLSPATPLEAKKKKENKNDRQTVTIDGEENVEGKVAITDAESQLYGEWTLVELHRKPYYGQRSSLLLDFTKNRMMGCLGTNSVNATFTLKGDKMQFANLVTTTMNASSTDSEDDILKSLRDTHAVYLTRVGESEYLNLRDKKGSTILKYRRQNIDYLNGGWRVKEVESEDVEKRNIKMVIDVDMLTVNATSGCNIINGVITIDKTKENAIEFEDLVSPHNQCPNLAVETRVLIALEETMSCKRLGNNEVALLDRQGRTVLLLHRLNVRDLTK